MTSHDDARRIALGLPGAHEQPHFDKTSFRVYGRIFATVPDEHHLNVMIDPLDVDGVMRMHGEACEELWWGKKLSGVRVILQNAAPELVSELLAAAWERKALSRPASRRRPGAASRMRPPTADNR